MGEEGGHEERVAGGELLEASSECVIGLPADQRGDEGGNVGRCQPFEFDDLTDTESKDARKSERSLDVVGMPRDPDERRAGHFAPDEVGEQQECGGCRPVEVIRDEQKRPTDGEGRDQGTDGVEEPPSLPFEVKGR